SDLASHADWFLRAGPSQPWRRDSGSFEQRGQSGIDRCGVLTNEAQQTDHFIAELSVAAVMGAEPPAFDRCAVWKHQGIGGALGEQTGLGGPVLRATGRRSSSISTSTSPRVTVKPPGLPGA